MLIPLGFFGGANRFPYFMETLFRLTYDNYPQRLHVNSTGEYWVGGSIGANPSMAVVKNSALGAIQWQRQLFVVGDPGGMTVDSSGNSYSSSNDGDHHVAKWNSAGTLQWQRRIFSSGGDYSYALKPDSSGNVYLAGSYNAGNFIALNIKLDSSGTILWQRQFHNNSDCQYYDVALDSSGNQYYSGEMTQGGGNQDILVTKYDSSGNFQWHTKFAGTAGLSDRGWGIAVDTSANVYVAGLLYTNNLEAVLIKLNSSGVLQWQRRINVGGGNTQFTSVVTDTAGNVYAAGFTNNSQFIVKYNSSGTIQWQRTISSPSSSSDTVRDLKIDANGDLWILSDVKQSTKVQWFVAKIPTDGSLTGTYSVNGINYTYAASSLTEAAGNATVPTYTPNPGAGTAGLSSAAGAKTENAASMTASTIKTIP